MGTAANLASSVNTSAPAITPATLDTSLTAPTHTSVFFTAGGSGSRIDRIRLMQIASTSGAGYINIFRKSGGTYYLIDAYAFTNVSLTATSQQAPAFLDYASGLILKSGDTLECAVTTTAGQSAFVVTVDAGGDF